MARTCYCSLGCTRISTAGFGCQVDGTIGRNLRKKGGFFVDLFVRVSNQVAVNMYKQLGYSVYRTVLEYYSASNGEPDEDAYDMRKALSRDTEKKSIIPLPHPVRPEDIE
eukprot:XP_027304392.1 N-alpha-acetyltransferase 20-like [Anas platyrhynchos]